MRNHQFIGMVAVLVLIAAGCALKRSSNVGKSGESRTKTPELFYFVGGEVGIPSRRPYEQGITVGGAILAAGGFTDLADKSKVQLVRARRGSGHLLDLTDSQSEAKDIELMPDDQVLVRRRQFHP